MTMPCPNCGETLPEGAYRCPACDALAPVPATDEPAPTQAMPWAIPIREGTGRPEARDPLRPVLYAVVAIALFAGLLVIASSVLGGDGDDEVAGDADLDPEVAGDVTDASTDGDDSSTSTTEDEPAETSTSTTASTTSTTTTSTTTTSTTSATTAPTTTRAATPGSAPQLSSSFDGGWVAQLTSVPVSAGADAVEAAWSKARSYASGAVVTRSDEWSSLQPGYWVVVDEGPFASADEVRSFCEGIGHADSSDCLPRELSGRR